MAKFRYRTSVALVALTIGCSTPDKAHAVSGSPPQSAALNSDQSTVPESLMLVAGVISGITDSFSSLIGPITSAMSTVGGITGGCTDMSSCMQLYFSQMAATNVNNTVMNASIAAKGNDYLATSQYALQVQGAQANITIQNGNTPGLQYMNNLQCVPATLSTGAAAANYKADAMVASDPEVAYAFSPNHTQVKDITNLFNKAATFYAIPTHPDSNIEYLMKEDVFTNNGAPDPNTPIDQGTTDQGAMDMYVSYIVGLSAEAPPGNTNPKNDPQDMQYTVAASERAAYASLAALPLQTENALHSGYTNPASQNISDLYTAGNIPINVNPSATAPGGLTSKAALLKAMFRMPGENPNTFINLNAMTKSKVLQYIAGIAVLSNYLDYEISSVENQKVLVKDGILSLQMRNMDFTQHP